MSDLSVAEIASLLRRNADALARELLPEGNYQVGSSEWKCSGSRSPTGYAISVHVGLGSKQGICGFWNGTQCGGDILDLIENVNGFSRREAVKWAEEWLGLGDAPATRANLAAKRRAQHDQQKYLERQFAERERRQQSAIAIWQGSFPLNGAARSYLIARGIEPAFVGNEVRSHCGLIHPEGGSFPALVARVTNSKGFLIGVWRIFVKSDGSGKAPVETPKMGLGNVKGGAVRIGGEWPEIGIAEGIETALACRQLIFENTKKMIPVYAALSTSGMRAIDVPTCVELVRIFADNDSPKFRKGKFVPSPGLEAADALRRRLEDHGIRVVIEKPPVGLDWLDVLNKQNQQKRKAA